MPRTMEGLARLIAREHVAPWIVDAFRAIDRADFAPAVDGDRAYRDRPIGLPQAQTTSQPSLIARMVDAAAIEPGDLVLEVGTGYGFQTAILGRGAARVISIERSEELAGTARSNLERAGVANATVVRGDGWMGVPEKAPFDSIVVSAAAAEVPQALVEQLAEGGRLVIPLSGVRDDAVYVFEKIAGKLAPGRLLTPARFVPLVRPAES